MPWWTTVMQVAAVVHVIFGDVLVPIGTAASSVTAWLFYRDRRRRSP